MNRSWRSMLRTIRASVAILLIGGVAIAAPPQTRDMLAFLDNNHLWPAVSFQIALFVFGASAWFWSRAALAARFGISDDRRQGGPSTNPTFSWEAFTWLPRFVLLAAFLVGLLIAVKAGKPSMILGSVGLGLLALLSVVFRPRTTSIQRPPPPRNGLWRLLVRGGWLVRLRTLAHHAPGGAWVASVLLGVDLVLLLLGVLDAYTSLLWLPNCLATAFPGPAVALLLLGLMIGPLVALTFVFDGWTVRSRRWARLPGLRRPPVLTALALWVFVLVPLVSHVHTVRLVDARLPDRPPLHAIFQEWAKACAPGSAPVRPIIVAISGGATRAGLWGAAVLDQVLQHRQANGAALFAVSSVSGGSLGAAAAFSLFGSDARPCDRTSLAELRPKPPNPVPLAGDALGPLLAGWLLYDIPRATFAPISFAIRWMTDQPPDGGDSAEAIEHGFERLWGEIRPDGAPAWDRPFLSLFYTETGAYRAGMPLWFANGTDAGTGNRVITTPIGTEKEQPVSAEAFEWPFRGARDFHDLMGADVTIATAINNTARFPYLEPFGEMLPRNRQQPVGSLIDGGYFDNEGLQTALELAEWLSTQKVQGRDVQPVIVQATGDGEADVTTRDVMTCRVASDGPGLPDDKHGAWQILAPLFGLNHVRGGHAAVLLRQAHDKFCVRRPDFTHFYLPADEGKPIPLNWVLSDKVAGVIWSAFTDQQVANASQLKCLAMALAPEAAASEATCLRDRN